LTELESEVEKLGNQKPQPTRYLKSQQAKKEQQVQNEVDEQIGKFVVSTLILLVLIDYLTLLCSELSMGQLVFSTEIESAMNEMSFNYLGLHMHSLQLQAK